MRFGRKKDQDDPATPDVDATAGAGDAAADQPASGPIDVSEVDPEATYIDLGSLLVQPPDGLDLRLQVDEQSGTVLTVLLVSEEGVLELRAFASARGGD